MKRPLGYTYLAQRASDAGRPVLPVAAPAQVDRVQVVVRDAEGGLRVPPHVAPAPDAQAVDHALFALRYEPLHLAPLAAAIEAGVLTADAVQAACVRTPTGQFTRRLGYLYEALSGQSLAHQVRPVPYCSLADGDLQWTRPQPRVSSTKWRLHDNAVGHIGRFSPLIRRTAALTQALGRDIGAELAAFIAAHKDSGLLDRAVEWAYLSETESTFAIERDAPSGDRRERFVTLLRQAGVRPQLTDEDLCELQRAAISNPFEQAFSYRTELNWLVSRSSRFTARDVTYLPPPPDALPALMQALLDYMNIDDGTDPRLRAAVAAFAFVYFHPFMDGNGRVSRFLVHDLLRRSGLTPDGLVLPVSVVMHQDEQGYTDALRAFSRPMRDLWDVTVIDESRLDARCRGSLAAYRYPDLTVQTTYLTHCVATSLDRTLVEEAGYLARFDTIHRAVNSAHDIRDKTLAHLINGALRNGGRVSMNLRRRYALEVPADAFDLVESTARAALHNADDGESWAPPAP